MTSLFVVNRSRDPYHNTDRSNLKGFLNTTDLESNRLGCANDDLDIKYQYDGGGNRIQKTVQESESISVTHYVRDASGNILATYNNEKQVKEFNIYGGSRLGIYTPKTGDYRKLILGYRNYEFSNHLSNVPSSA